MNGEETVRIARFLCMPERDFRTRYCRSIFGRTSLIERPNYDCVFLTPTGCHIYPVRPRQCRSFPFWMQSLRNPDAWRALPSRCPGVGRGKLYTYGEIQAILDGTRTTEP